VANTQTSPRSPRRALAAAFAVTALLGLAACGSSSSPVAGSSSQTTVAASTTTAAPTTTTAAASTTTATTVPATTVPATPTTTTGGGSSGAKDNPSTDKAFCAAVVKNAQKLISAGKIASSITSTGKPSKALIGALQTMAQVFTSLKPIAPAAIKSDVDGVAKVYSMTATALASGNQAKMLKASQSFDQSNAITELLNVEQWETKHCA
jgi:hypothetical protein